MCDKKGIKIKSVKIEVYDCEVFIYMWGGLILFERRL